MYDYYRIATAIDYIRNNFWRQPHLEEIAAVVHLSPFHFQRMFTDWAGISPKKFLKYISIEHAKRLLSKEGSTLFETAIQTGLSGTGRLHDLFVTIEQMTPGEYKNQGENLNITYSFNEAEFGNYLIAATDKGVINLLFCEEEKQQAYLELASRWPKATLTEGQNMHHHQVIKFFNRTTTELFKLHLKGTDFQLKVWEALLRIPEGSLASYGQIAELIKQPAASRAVGTAIGQNPIGYIIPCHRVIKKDGNFGNYRWGQTRKTAMIGFEGAKIFKDVS
ncbi:MAG: methylated-DNA--[protein]-cysteine S-methyltransferase [Bacteroidetes bacterium]|nr:methylated-DNA--[protein]-cysteine S-methyltransferase [Bacteroidota bacterium]MDA1121222.1 methylated-DNA--[protein]-cysteine S-methyltransferase [Bacteroidota bacterium]